MRERERQKDRERERERERQRQREREREGGIMRKTDCGNESEYENDSKR